MKTYLLLSISITLIVVLSFQFGRMIERYRVNKALQPTLERMRRIRKKIKENEVIQGNPKDKSLLFKEYERSNHKSQSSQDTRE